MPIFCLNFVDNDAYTNCMSFIYLTREDNRTHKHKHIIINIIIQAGADITGQLQGRPMLYTLYIDINLRVVKMIHTDNKQQITK